MKQKVLITGASGFVGRHLLDAALAKGLDVYTGIRKSSDISHLSDYPVTHTYPDYNDTNALKQELESRQYDYIIHAAGVTKAGSQEAYNRVNADNTFNLMTAASLAKIPLKKFVLISSLASVGPLSTTTDCINAETLPHPVDAYGRSKLLAEQKVQGFKLPWIILRPTAVYGPGEKDIFILFKMLSRGIEAYIGKGEQRLSFVYVKDLAKVTVDALFSEVSGRTYNITDGNAYGKYALADLIKIGLNKKSIRFHIPLGIVKGAAGIMEKVYGFFNRAAVVNREKISILTGVNWHCNIDRSAVDLGYRPAYNLEKGVKETLEWYKEKHWL